MIHRK